MFCIYLLSNYKLINVKPRKLFRGKEPDNDLNCKLPNNRPKEVVNYLIIGLKKL